jgi:signal transduction histidine kinase
MASFELLPAGPEPAGLPLPQGLGTPVLFRNSVWFIKVRWIVIGLFLTAGAAGRLLPGAFRGIGLVLPHRGLWQLAGGLAVANLLFYFYSRSFTAASPPPRLRALLWLQILVDLAAVTFLVHLIGSTQTFIAFTYLFHISLSCIFFPPGSSLLVSLIASALYLGTVTLELTGLWTAGGVLAAPILAERHSATLKALFAGSAVFVWFIVWYFVSSLSEAVRRRDLVLSLANEQLVRADQEKTRQVMLTTHDLKAPFAGIESNIQVLKTLHWAEMPPPVQAIIDRIDRRAQSLRERIRDILILGDLKAQGPGRFPAAPLDLREAVNAALEELAEKAESRRVSLRVEVPSQTLLTNRERLGILITNLVDNAVSYSHPGGTVELKAAKAGGQLVLSVSDQGIGIKEEALPHIFEEYYRTKNAARHNADSTGLGLSIVREIARSCGWTIRVQSELGRGTSFQVFIPTGGA